MDDLDATWRRYLEAEAGAARARQRLQDVALSAAIQVAPYAGAMLADAVSGLLAGRVKAPVAQVIRSVAPTLAARAVRLVPIGRVVGTPPSRKG